MAKPNGSSVQASIGRWYTVLVNYNVADLFTRKREPGPPRTIYVNQPTPPSSLDAKGRIRRDHVFTSNQIITSKYTLITFLPRNLLEQFRRVANVFFLGIAIIQFFHQFSTISPGAAILPLIVILVITALKDGYEDFKRHQSDAEVNYSQVRVLSGGNWSNPNTTEAKARSFIPPIFSRRPKAASNNEEWDYESHGNDLDKPHWRQTYWEDLKVGDFVKITDNQSFPADIVICATSEDENVAFVETKNLDGETNLKSRQAVPALSGLNNAWQCADSRNQFLVQCDRPDTDMYKLNANTTSGDNISPIDISYTLLRGTVLRNTDWVIGVVLFTGLDTKILMNSGGTPSKRSKVERQMNPQVFINLAILAVMAVVCAIADSALEKKFFPMDAPWLFADDQSDDNPKINGLITWAYALLTFQDIVPISLYISIEIVRTLQAAFIYFDADIYYEKTKQATIARSWNLSDDLGQIEYIFSDKTGTLTQNLMVFRMCSVAGKAYRGGGILAEELVKVKTGHSEDPVKVDLWDEVQPLGSSSRSQIGIDSKKASVSLTEGGKFHDENLFDDIKEATDPDHHDEYSIQNSTLNNFFVVLSLCHTVLTATNPETGAIHYKAQSPDESALVQAAADVGYVFLGKDREILSIRTPRSPDAERYELLDILEFTSARKRMSIIVRPLDSQTDGLLLLTKGADNVIFERLRAGEDELKQETERHLSEFASTGLRTLTLAYKHISVADYEVWSMKYQEASVSLDNREERMEAMASKLEQDLCLLGATAIEDRLQDGVPETIADLKTAGIKIWVATGDKLETAIAIGRSTNLITPDSNIIVIRGGLKPVEDQMTNALLQFFPESTDQSPANPDRKIDGERTIPLRRMNTGVSLVGEDNGDRPGGFILVIDGAALLEAFADEENKAHLLRLGILCDGVICCRVSPLQKALIVRLVKDGLGAMTLAIGDGANDVSMIQAADVGVGISGEEGLQAANSSDYSIAQFRFLKKLLLVHGHWSYARNGIMILNFFYKNIVPTGVLWWFQIYDGWSAAYVFDYTYILFWNSLWTVLPVIGIGLFDRFLEARTLMAVPELYRYGREGTWFGLRSFMIYLFDGVVQSVVIYFLIHYTYTTTSAREDGWDVRQFEFSTTMAISSALVANLFTGFTATVWTWWLAFAVAFGLVVQWVFTAIYSIIAPSFAVTNLYGNDHFLFRSAYFWLCIPLTFFVALAPRYLYRSWKFIYNPGDLETFQLLQKKYPGHDLSAYSRARQPAPALGMPAALRRESMGDRRISRADSVVSLEPTRFPRPSMDIRSQSRTDMATGLTSVDRGFDFATEEHGVEMRRVQTNLSERRVSKQRLDRQPSKGKDTLKHVLSLPRGFLRRKVSSAS